MPTQHGGSVLGVWRYDRWSELKPPERLSNGFLRVDGYLTRTGVFPYRLPDGTVRRELRTDEEVFSPKSLASFEHAPVTDKHPPIHLDAKNARQYAAGSAHKLRRDGKFLAGELMVIDEGLAEKVERGDAREVSLGYYCELEMTPGVTDTGERYDCIQRNIRGNHIALVPQGRAGAEVRVRMDAADAVQVQDGEDSSRTGVTAPTPKQEQPMPKFNFDGVDFEAPEPVVQVVNRLQRKADEAEGKLKKDADDAKAEASKQAARADAAEEKLTKVEKAHADAVDPKALRARMDARLELERTCQKHLDEEDVERIGEFSDVELMKATAIALGADEKRFDGKDESYVRARFDAAIEAAENDDDTDAAPPPLRRKAKADADEGSIGSVRRAVEKSSRADSKVRVDAADAREKMIEQNSKAWQTAFGAKQPADTDA